MSIEPMPPVRRIVTAIDAAGHSYIAEDGPSPSILTVPARPGYCVNNLWQTSDTPAPIGEPDRAAGIRGASPPPRGTVIRTIDIPPEAQDPAERRRLAEATMKALYGDVQRHGDGSPHPAHHTTESIDYAIVLEGEIWAVMDRGETLMRAGDVLIQRGTAHAWSNRSGRICRILFILIDGRR